MIHSFLMQMKGLLQLVGGFTTAVSKNDMFNFSNSHRISLRLFVGGKSRATARQGSFKTDRRSVEQQIPNSRRFLDILT